MSKLLSLLMAGMVAAGTAAAQTSSPSRPSAPSHAASGLSSSTGTDSGAAAGTTSPSGSGATSGSSSGAAAESDASATQRNTTNIYVPRASGSGTMGSNDGGARTYGMGAPRNGICPPGLEKQNSLCVPPGQAKKLDTNRAAPGSSR